MRLTREIRFFPGNASVTTTTNSWAGTPNESSIGPFWKLRATVDGPVDPRTGYVCSIPLIDDLLRQRAAPLLSEVGGEAIDLPARLRGLRRAFEVARNVSGALDVVAMEWHLSPYTHLRIERNEHTMWSVVHAYEFSAAHRLYCPDLSEAENRRLFGKCANPNGHGHNYVFEVALGGLADDRPGPVVDLALVDRIVKERVIDRFDHKHLNLDCPEFHSLNPSVENIARVIWALLQEALSPALLRSVRVWETPKTSAEYTGPD